MTVNSASKDLLSSSQYYILTASFFLGSMSLSSRFNLVQTIIPPRLLSSLQIVQRYKSQTVRKSSCCYPEMHLVKKCIFYFSYPPGSHKAPSKSRVMRNIAEMLKQIPHPGFHTAQASGDPLLQLSLSGDLPLHWLAKTCTRGKQAREQDFPRRHHKLKPTKLISLTWLPKLKLRWYPPISVTSFGVSARKVPSC